MVGLWGLDDGGNFIHFQRSWLSQLCARASVETKDGKKVDGVGAIVLIDLQYVQRGYSKELALFRNNTGRSQMTDGDKSKRLLYLFQKDLLSGISGQILESKNRRDNKQLEVVSRKAKWVAWAFLIALDVGMLFYIFLFAVSQNTHQQTAWAQSFGLWLILEICLISTCMVIVMHVILPSLIMEDVQQIKGKLVDSVAKYRQRLRACGQSAAAASGKPGLVQPFNAADYVFLSCRLAKTCPELKTAQIISQYRTVWPRQSYQHETDVSKSYNRKFSALVRSVTMVVFFFVTNVLSFPPGVQDVILQAVSAALVGSFLLVHIQLYAIYPALVILPSLLVIVVILFLVRAHRKLQEARLDHDFQVEVDAHDAQKIPEVHVDTGHQQEDEDNSDDDSEDEEVLSAIPEGDEDDVMDIHLPLPSRLVKNHEDNDRAEDVRAADDSALSVDIAQHTGRKQSLEQGLQLLEQATRTLAVGKPRSEATQSQMQPLLSQTGIQRQLQPAAVVPLRPMLVPLVVRRPVPVPLTLVVKSVKAMEAKDEKEEKAEITVATSDLDDESKESSDEHESSEECDSSGEDDSEDEDDSSSDAEASAEEEDSDESHQAHSVEEDDSGAKQTEESSKDDDDGLFDQMGTMLEEVEDDDDLDDEEDDG